MIAGGLTAAGVGWFCYSTKLAKHPVAAPVVAIVFGVVAVVAICIGVRRLLRPPLGLIVDREGIVPNPRRPADRILWTDLKGAHYAIIEDDLYVFTFPLWIRLRSPIVALDLADPQAFHRRRGAGKRPWLGYDTSMRSDYVPIYYSRLDTDASRLMRIIEEGIARQGRPAPNTNPQTTYGRFFP
jgi:hypothetical protein